MGSASSLLFFAPRHLSGFSVGRICLPHTLPAWTHTTNGALRLPPCVTPSLVTLVGGIGLSTDYPSPTPLGLGLGPGLPWVDDPSPGNLRLAAGRILTCLLAYLCRHSHFCSLHHSSRYGFAAYRTLPYHLILLKSAASVTGLAPFHFRRRAT